jgi:thiol-disulfide isomerase/thioredoxin
MADKPKHSRRRFIRLAARTIVSGHLGVLGAKSSQLAIEGDLPSFRGVTGWLNSQPLTKADLHGKVVLIDFWTYSCINWRRTLPYLRAWANKYKRMYQLIRQRQSIVDRRFEIEFFDPGVEAFSFTFG